MYCVIYDLEGSNDVYPQDANLTLVGEKYFPICFVWFNFSLG
jgi:hypothetical protein